MTGPPSSTSKGRPRLLFLGHGAERTGPPILLGHLLGALHSTDRYDLEVVVARSGPLLADYRKVAAASAASRGREPIEPLAALLRRAGSSAIAAALQRRWLRRRLAGHDGDLVYVNAATPPTAALLRALEPPTATPVLLHVHELDVGLRLTLSDRDRRFLFARADHVIAASDAVGRLLVDGHGFAPEEVTVCPEFVDVDAVDPLPGGAARRTLGIPADARVVGSVGLPDWRKDPERLLHAVHRIRSRYPDLDVWAVWIGGDPDSVDGRHLGDEARRLDVEDRFRHHPHTGRPDRLLGAFDVFALPAREDALPLAALEAAAAGLPLVCFDTGGVADLARSGAGTSVPYPDTAAFADAIARLLDDEDLRTMVGRRARTLVTDGHDVIAGAARIARVIDRWRP